MSANAPIAGKVERVYTKADGLPNDHIFAVKSDGDRLWVGTEGGLALIDKKVGKVVKSWTEKDCERATVAAANEARTRTAASTRPSTSSS